MQFEDYTYVFVITYARSGSTLLQSLLNSVPGVQIRGENNNALFHMFRTFQAVQQAKALHGKQATARDTPWYGAENLTPASFKRNLLNLFVAGVLKPSDDAKVIGFKEIRHIPFFMSETEFNQYCQFILNSFPKAKIIFNSRNPVDVSKSAWLREQPSATVIRGVRAADERFRKFAIRAPEMAKRVIHLEYDKYIQDDGEIHRLFDFLGFEYDKARVRGVMDKRLTHAQLHQSSQAGT